MDNLMILLGFILTIQMKSPIVGILQMIFHHLDMNHFLNELHHRYPYSGIHPLLHLLENSRLTNLLHIEWSYHLSIQLLEETSRILVIDLVFRTDINISDSWLAIIQNAYYWKEMKQMIHLLNALEKNLHLLLQEHTSGFHHDSDLEKHFLNFELEHLISIDQLYHRELCFDHQLNKDDLLEFL